MSLGNNDPSRIFRLMEPRLQEVWEKRLNDDNTMIVIGASRREGIKYYAIHSPHIEHVDNGVRYYAYLQPLKETIRVYTKQGRQIGPDLEKHKYSLEAMGVQGAVILVCTVNHLWATCWSPDGSVVHV